jgi:hypothetical protein
MCQIPAAELHTPDELLANAISMQASGDTKLFRGAILEAITALEAFVQKTVFKSLEGKLDPILVKWLEDKTKMDFDSRLSILAPVATGLQVDKKSTLWDDYKKAKEIRNKVVHSGRKVSEKDVESVIATVRDWLSYLGSTVELETVLLNFKRWAESRQIAIENEAQATHLICRFFQQTGAAAAEAEVQVMVGHERLSADLVLDFGPRKVLVETKYVRDGHNPQKVTRETVEQVDLLRRAAQIGQACIIIFLKGKSFPIADGLERHHNGEIVSIVVRVS